MCFNSPLSCLPPNVFFPVVVFCLFVFVFVFYYYYYYYYYCRTDVNQKLIESIMDGMTKKRAVNGGKQMSLCDLGYCDVGLDDNWQKCGATNAAPGMHYHDINGNPIVNTDLFPDFKSMTDHAHSLGLTSGWYGNK